MGKIDLNKTYVPSEKIVARNIEDELIIVPIESGTFNTEAEDSLYSLKGTGKSVWEKLDNQTSVKKLCSDLASIYNAPVATIEKDVKDLLNELLAKGIIIESV